MGHYSGRTNLRSVTWTKVSLKEAKIRATPKTRRPIKVLTHLSHHVAGQIGRTVSGQGAERDVLLGRGGSLLGRHCDSAGWDGIWRGEGRDQKQSKIDKKWVCALDQLLDVDWSVQSMAVNKRGVQLDYYVYTYITIHKVA